MMKKTHLRADSFPMNWESYSSLLFYLLLIILDERAVRNEKTDRSMCIYWKLRDTFVSQAKYLWVKQDSILFFWLSLIRQERRRETVHRAIHVFSLSDRSIRMKDRSIGTSSSIICRFYLEFCTCITMFDFLFLNVEENKKCSMFSNISLSLVNEYSKGKRNWLIPDALVSIQN